MCHEDPVAHNTTYHKDHQILSNSVIGIITRVGIQMHYSE